MSENISASDLVYRHSLLFGKATIEAAIPNKVDGLKPVHRRILVSVMDHKGVIHSPKLAAETAELHPHGEGSIYHAAVRMGQTFEYNPSMLTFDTAHGTYSEPKPAAMRYTSASVSEFTQDIFFKGIEFKALPKQLGELMISYEPTYLAPAIPTTLLYANKTIGYGYSSYTIPHNLADVCDLVVAFTQHQKLNPMQPFDYAPHATKFLPDFPILGTLTNHQELLAAYRRGDFKHKIRLDGEVKLTADTIVIKTLPYSVPFSSLVESIEGLISEKNSAFDRMFQGVKELSSKYEEGEVSVQIKRGVSVFEAWEMLRKKIEFSSAITPIPNYNTEGYATEISQPNLLRVWYEVRYNILVASKKMRITQLTENVRRVEAHLIICDNIDEVVQLIRANDRSTGIELLQKRFSLTPFQATYLVSARLDTLSKTAKEELQQRLDNLNQELQEIRDSFTKIPDEMAAEAVAIKKKYATPRRTKIPNYLGYVRIGGGCIQIESIDEIGQIIKDFPKVEMEIYMYDGSHLYKVSENNKLESGAIPKITTGDIYGLKSNQVVTVNITEGTACCVKGFIPGMRKAGYFYTTPKSRVIRRNGEIRTVEVTEEISLRKTICRGASTDIIYVYPDLKAEHYVIALNTSTPNVIVIQRVGTDRTKISMNPQGEVYVVHSVHKHAFFNTPPKFLNRNATRVVEFVDLDKLLEGSDQVRLDIAVAKVKSNRFLNLL